jgi:hypothetical protein
MTDNSTDNRKPACYIEYRSAFWDREFRFAFEDVEQRLAFENKLCDRILEYWKKIGYLKRIDDITSKYQVNRGAWSIEAIDNKQEALMNTLLFYMVGLV